MITLTVLVAWSVIGGGVWLFERKKRRERERAQAFEDEWLGRNQEEKRP